MIVESGSMTRAAEMLGVSHSGLSKSISVLQTELGMKIFRAAGRGLELTTEGKEVYTRSRRILEMVNELRIPDTSTEKAPLRLAVPEAFSLASAGKLTREMGPMTLAELDSGELEEQIASRQVDFGITFVPSPRADVEHLKITSVILRSFARPGVFDDTGPEGIPYVIPSSDLKDNALSLKFRDGWNHLLPRRTPYRADRMITAIEMVRSGACAIYVPTFVVLRLNEQAVSTAKLEELSLPASRRTAEATKRDVFLVKRKSEEESKTMKSATRIFKQVCAGS